MNMTNGAGGGFGVSQTNPGTAGGNNAGNQKRRTVIEQLNQGLNNNQQRVNTQMEGSGGNNGPDQKGINQSLIKQKWSNNKNAFSGPLHKKSGEGGKASEGSNSKGNS